MRLLLLFLFIGTFQTVTSQQFSNYTEVPSCVSQNNGSIILGFDQAYIDQEQLTIHWLDANNNSIAEGVPAIYNLASGTNIYNPVSSDGCDGYHLISVASVDFDFSLISVNNPVITSATCANNNGSIALVPPTPSVFNITWHQGDENGAVLPASDNDPALLENLAPGLYTVVVEHIETGCTAVESYKVTDINPFVIDPHFSCSTNEEGTWIFFNFYFSHQSCQVPFPTVISIVGTDFSDTPVINANFSLSDHPESTECGDGIVDGQFFWAYIDHNNLMNYCDLFKLRKFQWDILNVN